MKSNFSFYVAATAVILTSSPVLSPMAMPMASASVEAGAMTEGEVRKVDLAAQK